MSKLYYTFQEVSKSTPIKKIPGAKFSVFRSARNKTVLMCQIFDTSNLAIGQTSNVKRQTSNVKPKRQNQTSKI